MTTDITIHIEGQSYQSHDIKRLKTIEDLTAYGQLSEYSQQTLAFCHAWLQGHSTFEIHTSGSTGTPKLIQITREQMQASAQATGEAVGLKVGDRAFVCLNTTYIAGKMMLVRGLELGMSLIVYPPSSLPLAPLEENTALDFTALVPLQLKSMLEAEDDKYLHILNRMKGILLGGAAAGASLEALIRNKLQAPVYSTYGMTETVSHIALRRLNGPAASEDYEILPGVEVKLDDRDCLAVKGKVSNEQWLQTNDIVKLTDDRHFRWLGRFDNVINSGGVKLFADRLEQQLQPIVESMLRSERFFLAGLPDEKLGQKLCLILERETALTSEEEDNLRTWMSAHLHPYEIPKEIILLPQFALSPSGKIRRKHTLALLSDNL